MGFHHIFLVIFGVGRTDAYVDRAEERWSDGGIKLSGVDGFLFSALFEVSGGFRGARTHDFHSELLFILLLIKLGHVKHNSA
jgi:hypothetical protein